MCQLIVVKKGVSKSSDLLTNAIKKASLTNTDGIGYAFKRHKSNKIYISKGFRDVDEFLEILEKKNLKLEDELIIHLRIGNKGAKTATMNHPFVLSDDDDIVLSNHKYVDIPVMAHNGTLYDFTNYSYTLESDTYVFARDFMSVPELQALLKRDVDLFVATFKFTLKLNRLAFLFPDNTPLITIGEFIEDEGYLFSNDSYKVKVYNIGGVTHTPTCQCIDCKTKRMNAYYDDEYEGVIVNKPKLNSNYMSHYPPITKSTEAELKLRETLLNGGHHKSIGERKRDSDNLLEVNPKFDIIPPATSQDYISIFNVASKITLYPIAGYFLYTPLRYMINQFNSTMFVPKKFNYKHFTFYNALGNDDRSINSKEHYRIHEFDVEPNRVKHPVHLLGPIDHNMGSIRGITDLGWFTTQEIVRYFTALVIPELRPAYMTLYRLLQKYSVPSKNLCLQAGKAINGALKKNDENKLTNITFKAINSCTITGLKLFYNYQAECMYGSELASKMYYPVQEEEDDKSISLTRALQNINAM